MPQELSYRDFYYPLNVFMHVLTLEEGQVRHLHYGLFENPEERIGAAQERSTELLLRRLPAPPARILEVGLGLGTTLDRLTRLGYHALGITPDAKQIAAVRRRFGDQLQVEQTAFEQFVPRPFDVVMFQESAQYIAAQDLFTVAAATAPLVIVLDEFATGAGTLHRLTDFLRAAEDHRFRKTEEIDLSREAAPTVDYFMARLDRLRPRLMTDLGLTAEQIDALIASGETYRRCYADGTYVYRLLQFRRK